MATGSDYLDNLVKNTWEKFGQGQISLHTGSTPVSTEHGGIMPGEEIEDVRWQGHDTADIYGAQDDCLIAIQRGNPVPVRYLQRIPPWRSALLADIADKAGTGLEKGTAEQLRAEAKSVGGNGKLGSWWDR